MKKLKLYNTLSRNIEEFIPIDINNIRMYVCGPTVYDRAHIGNARPAVVFDILYRILKKIYKKVTYVRNITDIDDKIYKASLQKNITIEELTKNNIRMYHEDIDMLNVLDVDIEPLATDHIPEMINFIEKLIKNKNAYISNNNVYFDITSFKNYGILSKKNLNDLISGSRIEISESKKNDLDFVLWKPIDDNFNFGWDSPWGKGRPGWHIECSAMSLKYLGETFDIHAGGIDLVFPHHENEIAQSCCANKKEIMAKYWVHNGHLNIDNVKMSKSIGNILTINELLKNYDGEVIRLSFLMSHYMGPMNFSFNTLDQSKNILDRWYNSIKNIKIEKCQEVFDDVFDSLLDNLNTPKAISILSQKINDINKDKNNNIYLASVFVNTCQKLLGLMNKDPNLWFHNVNSEEKIYIENKIKERNDYKKNKNYIESDRIREELLERGILIEDTKDGKTSWKKRS